MSELQEARQAGAELCQAREELQQQLQAQIEEGRDQAAAQGRTISECR